MQKETIRNTLQSIYKDIASLDDEAIRFGPKMPMDAAFQCIYALADLEVPESVVDELLADASLLPAIAAIDRLRSIYGPRLETEQAQQLLDSDDPWAYLRDFLFYSNYVALAAMERRGANLAPGQRVLFLGSGPLPLSLILLCNGADGQMGIGIEQKEERVALSQNVIRRLGLAQAVFIRRGNHYDLPTHEPVDLIMVGSEAQPKDAIFAQLRKTLPSGAKVSFRTYEKGLRRLLHASHTLQTPEGFRELARVQPEAPVINTCVFLEKL